LEKRRPQGTENLVGLLHAIKNKLQIAFTYHKFWEDEFTKRLVEPYALKEFKNRWYVLAKDQKEDQIKTFALDRLTELVITQKHFQIPIEFNINDYFNYCFGIITPSSKVEPEEIILSFTSFQGKYIKSLPLHETQEVLKDDDDSLLIKMKLNITHDFIMELLSMGENVKVIQPKSLIDDIKAVYKEALENYN